MSLERLEEMVRGLTTASSNGRHTIERQVAEGDRVAKRLTWTAMHVVEFNGVPAGNRPVRISGDALGTLEGGRIVEHHAPLRAMGLMV